MFFISSSNSRTRATLARSCSTIDLLQFCSSPVAGFIAKYNAKDPISKSTNQYCIHPLACSWFFAMFSTFSGERSNFGAHPVEKLEFDNGGDGYGGFRKMGSVDFRDLKSSRSPNVHGNGNPNFRDLKFSRRSNGNWNGNPNFGDGVGYDDSCEKLEFYNGSDEHGRFRKMGSENFRDLKFSRRSNLYGNENPNIGDGVEYGDSGEEGIADFDDGGGDDFVVLDSFNRNQPRKEYVRFDDGYEDELRHPLVREVCRLIELRSSWNPNLEGELRNLLRSLKPLQVCAVLHSQADKGVALSFFYWAARQYRYRHAPIVYYAMLEVLSKSKLCMGAKRVLRLMYRRGIERRPEAFAYVMVSCSRDGRLTDAIKVMNMMQKAGVQPNLLICNTAVHAFVMSGRLDRALKFLYRMVLVGIAPDVVTYNCLIKGYCNVNRVEDAIKLIDEMSSKGCSPDKVSYHTVIGFLCKEKRTEAIRELIIKMAKDSNLLPDQVTYNTLVHMLTKHNHGDEALEFLREAENKGFRVDKFEYSAIVHSFVKDGKIQEAKEIVNEMVSKGCLPDVVTHTAMLNGYCLAGKVDKAKETLQQMYKLGCKPNTVSYTALLNGLCHNGNSSEAREMMNTSEENFWTPNAVTYSVVMHGLRREGKVSEARDVAIEMVKKGFFPTPVEINLLLQSLCQDGKTDEAKRLLEECLTKGCDVNVVNFSTVIHGFCREDDLETALSLLDDMYLVNKHPDAITYTMVIDVLGKKGRIDEVTELTMKMLQKGLVPTPIMYRMIIHRYCKMDRVEDLLIILEKMVSRQKCKTIYNQVIEKLCSLGKLKQAEKLLSKVLRTASRADAHTCHVLIDSYLSKADSMSAYKVACRMFNRNLIPDLKLCEKVSQRLVSEGKLAEADKLMLRFVERGRILPQKQREFVS